MAWSKKKKTRDMPAEVVTPAPAKKTPESAHTFLSESLEVEGVIRAEGDIILAGKLDGELNGKRRVVISGSGVLEGQVKGGSVEIHGSVNGDIEASQEIIIHATGRVRGDITTPKLTHEPGGIFEGYSHMLPEPREKQGKKSGKNTGNEGKQDDHRDPDGSKK